MDHLVRDVAERLLKSLLRSYVYEHTLKDRPWVTEVLALEQSIHTSASQDWEQVLLSYNTQDPTVRTSLGLEIEEAFRRAFDEVRAVLNETESVTLLDQFARDFNHNQILPV
jgi:hypothetical protein